MTPIRRWLARWRRHHTPIVRYWAHDWTHLHTTPSTTETWPHWAIRQARRLPGPIVFAIIAITTWTTLTWLYDHTQAPPWCTPTWMHYTRDCIGWTLQR